MDEEPSYEELESRALFAEMKVIRLETDLMRLREAAADAFCMAHEAIEGAEISDEWFESLEAALRAAGAWPPRRENEGLQRPREARAV
jgi:hypothetical protein